MPKAQSRPIVVIILPTYNESDSIGVVVEVLQKVFKKEPSYNFSILVVDDNSPDGTSTVVKGLTKKFSNIFLLTGEKNGLGAAYVRGMHYAVGQLKADILFEMDADLQHDPELIPTFLRKIEEGADYVVGSRYIKGGSIPSNWGIDRKIYSVAGNLVIRSGLMMPHIHEWTSGYRAMRSAVFQKISNDLDKYKGYIFQIASMHRVVQAHYKIAEVPINFIDRKYGKSKIIPKEYIPDILRYILLHSSFVRFVITGGIGFIVDFGLAYIFIHYFYIFKPTANALSAEVSILGNFFINNFWSFNHKRIEPGSGKLATKFIQFNLVGLGAVLIQYVGMYVALHVFGDTTLYFYSFPIHTWILYKIAVIALFLIPYSYFMYNRFIWKTT